MLLGRDYDPTPDDDGLHAIAEELCAPHAKGVVISGVPREGRLVNYVYTPAKGGVKIDVEKIGPDRSGTGDVFASVIIGALVNGLSLDAAVRKAVAFVAQAVRMAEKMEIPTTDGLPFEEVLSELWS